VINLHPGRGKSGAILSLATGAALRFEPGLTIVGQKVASGSAHVSAGARATVVGHRAHANNPAPVDLTEFGTRWGVAVAAAAVCEPLGQELGTALMPTSLGGFIGSLLGCLAGMRAWLWFYNRHLR
jgi:hypothetical protein